MTAATSTTTRTPPKRTGLPRDAVMAGTPSPALHVYRVGAGEPLVLLHGLGESHIGWRPVIDALSAEYDVIAIDLPGFGRSPALARGISPTAANLAGAVADTLDSLGVDRYHVAGYSLGARVAVQLAGSDRARSLIAIAPDGLGTPLERVQGFIAMLAGRGVAMALAPVAEPLSWFPAGRAVFFAGTRSLPWQLAPADAKQLLTDFAGSPSYDATNWASLFDMPTHLHTITAPALFLQGTADPLMTPQIARYVGFIPGAQLIYLAGLNHVPISDDPKAVAQHMLSFLGRQRPASPSTA
ncbi:MAG: alpha/beta fold hydrolase [Nakamurella sp.]